MAPRGPPGGGTSFGKTSGRTSHKRSRRTRRQRFLHEIVLDYGEIYLRHRHRADLVGYGYRGRLVVLLNVCPIRGSMGRANNGCFLGGSSDRVNSPVPDVALDVALFEHQGKRRLIVVQRPLRVCAVVRRRFSSGCKTHPATGPAGSDRSRHGGDEMAEAFGIAWHELVSLDFRCGSIRDQPRALPECLHLGVQLTKTRKSRYGILNVGSWS